MTSQQRGDLLAMIDALSERYQDWRWGQLVANVAGWADREIWDVEDAEWLEAARLHLEQSTSRESLVSNKQGGLCPPALATE
jgi:hypothetical protein